MSSNLTHNQNLVHKLEVAYTYLSGPRAIISRCQIIQLIDHTRGVRGEKSDGSKRHNGKVLWTKLSLIQYNVYKFGGKNQNFKVT